MGGADEAAATVVLLVAELLPALGSVAVVITVAVDAAVPTVAAVALTVIDADCDADRSPRLHVIKADALVVHVPLPALTVPGVRAAAS